MKRIKVGILGCGYIAEEVHIPNLFNIAEFKIAAICDISEERLNLVGNKFDIPIECRFCDEKEFLSQDFEAIIICTPTQYHYDNVKRALMNGKHVFVEKPLCENIKEAKELVEIAKENGLVLAVGHFYGFFPQHQIAKKRLSKIGKVKLVKMMGQTLIIKEEDGALLDYSSHFIHLLLWYFDYVDFEWVFAELVSDQSDGKETDTYIFVKLKNDVIAQITVLWLPEYGNWDVVDRFVEFVGTKGKIIASFTSSEVKLYISNTIISRARGMYSITPTFALHPAVPVSQTSYRKELEDFRDAILKKKQPSVDGEKALKVLELIEAIRMSFKTGRKFYHKELS